MSETAHLTEELLEYYGQLSRNERPDLNFDIQTDTPWEVMRRLAQEEDPELAWLITQDLLVRAPDSALRYIAAGPLEDLISFHGVKCIKEIEEYADRNPRLIDALDAVIVDRWVPRDVTDRLRNLCRNLRMDDAAQYHRSHRSRLREFMPRRVWLTELEAALPAVASLRTPSRAVADAVERMHLMACDACGGAFLHGVRCPRLESKLKTLLVVLAGLLVGAILLELLGASIAVRLDVALGLVVAIGAAWLLVRRGARRDDETEA